jgi:hypothetical protein
MLTQNIGDRDRTVRVMTGAVTGLVFSQLPDDTARVIVGVASVILLGSSLTGWSLLYFVLRVSTRSNKDVKPLDQP